MAVDEGDGGRLAVGKFIGEREAEIRAADMRSLCSPISSKTRAPSPRITGTLETGYQTTLPKPRRPVKSTAMESQSVCSAASSRRADSDEALRGLRNGAGVGDVELNVRAGGERGSEGDSGFVKLAGVIDVGIEGGDGEDVIAAGEANALPIERRGDLQWNVSERGVAVIAHSEERTDGDLLRGGTKMHVHVERR